VLVSAPTVFRDGLLLLLARWGYTCVVTATDPPGGTHLANVYAKLDASGRAGAVAKAMRLGLIE
jgi:hypothetical protein